MHELAQAQKESVNIEAFGALSPKQKGEVLAWLLSQSVNVTGASDVLNSLSTAIRSDHRYLQGVIYGGITKLIRDVAGDYDAQRYDARDEVHVRLFKAITDEFLICEGKLMYINEKKLPEKTVTY